MKAKEQNKPKEKRSESKQASHQYRLRCLRCGKKRSLSDIRGELGCTFCLKAKHKPS